MVPITPVQLYDAQHLPKHNAALATEPPPVGELHRQVTDGLTRVESQRLILAICKQHMDMFITISSGKARSGQACATEAALQLGAAAAAPAELSQLAVVIGA